ncbi:MAG: UDP-glucuronic acid decarboxylase family protein [Polyangiales bacterium]
MRVIVTGGAGFVGANLTEALLRAGHAVVVVDNFFTGRRENLVGLDALGELTVVDHDVIAPFPDLGAAHRLYHLACPASPPAYQKDPIFTTKTAVLGTLHALEYASSHGTRLLLASTSEIYGDPEVHPQREDYRGAVNTTGPRACYDEGKRVGESLAADFVRARGADVRIARIFNTYGPRMDPKDGRVVSNFLVQALRGEALTVYGDGSQTRSFCYVDDLVRGLMGLMETAKDPGPTNLGNPTEFTIRELVDAVGRVLGTAPRIETRPLPTDDPTRRRPDIGRAKAAFGFEPATPLEEGLRHTAAYFRALVGEGNAPVGR